jgi:hypothetical protein
MADIINMKYHLVCYATMTPNKQCIKQVLLSNVDPVAYLKSISVCGPLAISELTKIQFDEMKKEYSWIKCIDNEKNH